MLAVTTADKAITYRHNALGQRVAKLVDGVVTEKYLWQDLTTLLAVYDANSNVKQRFEYGLSHTPVSFTQSGQRYYMQTDHLGSPRVISNSSGNIVKAISYDSYGNVTSDSNPEFAIPFGFAGGLQDSDTGLIRFGYRDYDPETGRWTARDPIGFAGGDTNLYGYVLGDPVNFIDPDGLEAWGVSFGGSYTTKDNVAVGISITLALDSQGNFAVLYTPEIGGGIGKGASTFGRFLFGFGDNTIHSLEGHGKSVSANIGRYSGSITLPYKHTPNENGDSFPLGSHGFYSPVVEVGFGRGKGASMTYGHSVILYENDALGRFGRWLGNTVYDLCN